MFSSSVTATNSDCASVLVRISRECGVDIEHLRAEQLVREAQAALPGDEAEVWDRWLLEACGCLGLRSHRVELTVEEAVHLAEDGALVVGGYCPDDGLHVLLGADRNSVQVASDELDGRERQSITDLTVRVGLEDGAGQACSWLVVEHPELSNADEARHLHGKPIQRLKRIIQPEWRDIWMILVFAFFAGVLNLATPIAVEALVNTVAFGRLLQPVLVLAVLLFGFLAFAGVMQAMQTYVAEIIQRRLFARVSADLAYRLPRVDSASLDGKHGPELVNRFLDVVTLQKVVASLLLDGVSIVLATLVGMTVLAFYHPWLLGFDVLLLVMIVAGLYVLGRGAVSSGIDESKMKYRLTAWYEDLMRCPHAFKLGGGADFAADRANTLTSEYLTARRTHFSKLFGQITFVLGLQALAGTVLLGAGGWLVIQGQLSLGQLVAAELIVTTILTSMAKLGKHIEGYYDAVAAVDKLGALFDLGVERRDGQFAGLDEGPLVCEFSRLRSRHSGWLSVNSLTETIDAGERVAVLGPAGSGKTTIARMLNGMETPATGRLTLGGADPRDVRPDVLRSLVAYAGESEIFEGTIADNVHLRRPGINANQVRVALEKVGLLERVLALPNGIDTKINAGTTQLSSTQQRLLMIARAIVGRPQLLVIDAVFDALPDFEQVTVLDRLTATDNDWTLVITTGKSAIAAQLDRTIALEDAA